MFRFQRFFHFSAFLFLNDHESARSHRNLSCLKFNKYFWDSLTSMEYRVAKRGIAPTESPLFLAPQGRGRGRGQLFRRPRGITGTGTRYSLGEFWGIFLEDACNLGKGTGTVFCFGDFQRNV